MSWTGQSWGPEQPRFAVDLTGDGSAEISSGSDFDGVWASLNTGADGFLPPNMVLCGFNFHTGWLVERHPRFVADLTGDGRADLIGFGDAGVWTASEQRRRLIPEHEVRRRGYGIQPGLAR